MHVLEYSILLSHLHNAHTHVVEQPSAEQSVCAGQTLTLGIVAGGGGTPLRYEWQFTLDPKSGWSAITEPRFEGASSSQLAVQKVQNSDGGHYRCVVYSKARDQQPVKSDTATVTVGECCLRPSYTKQLVAAT